MTSELPRESKLVIDEDWKEKVRREKEAAAGVGGPAGDAPAGRDRAGPEQQAKPDQVASSAPREPGPGTSREPADDFALPPASFDMLTSMLATQAAAALGQFPGPDEDRPVVRRNLAQHYIDILAMLEQKTRGNLTPEEDRGLSRLLHELRLLFIAVR